MHRSTIGIRRGPRRWRPWAVVCAALLAAGLSVAAQSAHADPAPAGETVPAPTSPVIGGWLAQGTPNFSNIQMGLVTTFYWAFSSVQNGQCSTASTAGLNAVLAERQLHPNLKVLRSIGGWGAMNFPSIATTAAERQTFVASCIQAFVANGVTDGFDLDWEYPVSGGLPNVASGPQDRENFNLLVDEFRTQLNAYADAHGLPRSQFWITADLPGARWEDSGDGVHGAPYDVGTSYDLATLGRTLNTINVMAFDMGNGYTPLSMFNQPLYRSPLDTSGDPWNSIADAIRYFEAAGVPADKITLASEFTLQRGYLVTDTLNNGRFRPWTATGCGTATMANALRAGSTVLLNWDKDVESPYIWDPANKRICSYENAQSLGLHASFAKDHGLNGMVSWELSGDSANSQLRAIAKPFEPGQVTPPAPTVTAPTITAVAGQPFTGEVAHVTGSAATSLTAEINWGDNTHSSATVQSLGNGEFSVTGTHTYTATGNYPMTVAIVDPDPLNSRMIDTMLKVFSAASLITDQIALVGSTGGGSFAAQLQAALDAVNAGETPDACGILGAYVDHVHAQSGKQLSATLAGQLLANAQQIQALLGC